MDSKRKCRIRTRRMYLVGTGLLAILPLVAAGVTTAGPLMVQSPVLASGPSPFADCTVGGPGTIYVNAEVEPRIAVNRDRLAGGGDEVSEAGWERNASRLPRLARDGQLESIARM